MSCTCQVCHTPFKVDVLVANELWEKIKPLGKGEGQGLLCGKCIMLRIEALDKYGVYELFGEGHITDKETKFEYKILDTLQHSVGLGASSFATGQDPLEMLKEGLDYHGKEGWLLCSVIDSTKCIFVREKKGR